MIVLVAAGLVLAACSSSSGSAESATSPTAAETSAAASASATPTESVIGGEAVCDEASLTAEVERVLTAGGSGMKLVSVDGFKCADGWGVITASYGEDPVITTNFIFQAEGQFWLPKMSAGVCGTGPDDAQVPADLYDLACSDTMS